MKLVSLFLLLCALCLTGCFDDTTDIEQFMADVKVSTSAKIPPLPPVKAFEHLPYTSSDLRSPFSLPSPEAYNQLPVHQPGCIQPDNQREKHALEQFAVDNLKMRGTLGHADQLWALIEASDQSLHRISINDRLGLFHGKVIAVKPDYIEITEFIPDGSGCTVQRNSKLQLLNASADATETN
ncbi:MAG: pilus assembly protein PilP [Gammaproteobacteria bacterium]|nr:pilus assembly protein PilP [Gammaproteobacteria bacterium]MBU2056332.1 pilus assembly protein PilP [Gammaproteobacteria bacterium]MBU2177225.1 pilus assembly protein PilP [Gammaproteobacteria bacterium]MBU2246127.1 pilus assembly protein PilP [Gammaproteobacteria bacterium]MBU2344751.1 pilus assembly protein PilP [Gammaproteobacteria bacterium]